VSAQHNDIFVLTDPTTSLPCWIAYWTIGFEMTTNWYCLRIQKNLSLIFGAFQELLPANRAFCLHSPRSIASIVTGLRGSAEWEGTDWDHDKLFSRFKDYVLDEESKLKTMLRRLAYRINDDALLPLMGSSAPEQVRCNLFTRLQIVMTMQRTDHLSSMRCLCCASYWSGCSGP
jgi:hypothetical protein